MNHPEKDEDVFSQSVRQAAVSLRDGNCDNAYGMIVEAMQMNPDAPQPHNLLGIFYELTGNGSMARRHYRAAYSLDPAYKPAYRNLERICVAFDDKPNAVDFGEISEEPAVHTGMKE